MPSFVPKLPDYFSLPKRSLSTKGPLGKHMKEIKGSVITIDKRGIITGVSQEFLNLIEQPKSLVASRNLADFMDSQVLEKHLLVPLESPLKNNKAISCFRGIWKAGPKQIHFLFKAFISRHDDPEITIFAQKMRKEQRPLLSQEWMDQIMQQFGAVIWLGSTDPRHIYYVSPNFEHSYGMTLEEYLADPSLFLNRVHPKDLDNIMKLYDPAEGVSMRQGEFRYRVDKKSWRHITFYRFPLYNKSGKPIKFVGVAIDNTDLCNAQKQSQLQQQKLIRIKAELEKAKQIMEDCHDLMQPLRALKIYSEILENDYLQSID